MYGKKILGQWCLVWPLATISSLPCLFDFLLPPFSPPFHSGLSSSEGDLYYCSTSAMEIPSLLQVLEATVTQIIATESSEEHDFRCKAGCRPLLGTFLGLLLQSCLPSWRVTPPGKDFLFPCCAWLLVDMHIAACCPLLCSGAGGVSHQNAASRHPASTPRCWRACA